MKISTQTENQNQIQKMLQSMKTTEKNKLKISKPQLQHFMQNRILKQAKAA